MGLKEDWKTAKTKWEKNGVLTLEAPVLAQMKKSGWDKENLGKKLESFDKATAMAEKRSAWLVAKTTSEKYQDLLRKAKKASDDKPAMKGIDLLDSALTDIVKAGNVGVQDPKPSGRAERVQLVAAQNAAGGVRTKWLEIGAIDIKAYLVVDALVMQLEKANEVGFHWAELQKACAAEVAKTTDAFAKTILALDKSLQVLSEKDRDAKVKEANEVLKHYRSIIEDNVNRVVDDYWARALKRQAYLKDFKKECKTDIVMSGVAIAVSAVSIGMSFGGAAVSVLVIAKAVLDIALTLEKLDRSAEATGLLLAKNFLAIKPLYEQRLAAKTSGGGQKASKTAQAGKTAIASALGPISEKLMTTTPRTLKQAKEYVGKLSDNEILAGQLNKKLVEYTNKFASNPKGPDARVNATMDKLNQNFRAMHLQYNAFATQLRADIDWGEHCIDTCEKLADEDAIVTFTNKAGTAAKSIAALGSLAKLGVQLAGALA